MVLSDESTRFERRPRVTISGSFRRNLSQIQDDVATWMEMGCDVLSPADPRLVDAFGEFVFVASDRVRTLRVVQDRHLEAIRRSDVLWLVCPEGYVGTSASLEVGVAVGLGVPVFAQSVPADQTMRLLVRIARSPSDALRQAPLRQVAAGVPAVLEPEVAVDSAHRHLEQIELLLTRGDLVHRERDDQLSASAAEVRDALRGL